MNDQLVLKKLSELESFFKEFRAMIESTMFKPDLEGEACEWLNTGYVVLP